MINEKELDEFVKELRADGIEFDPKNKEHWIGFRNLGNKKEIISNQSMKTRCENFFGAAYILLSDSSKRVIRERVFRKLRQFEIKKQIRQLRGGQNG